MFANGDDAKNLIISERDFKAEFNIIGICAYHTKAKVLGFSIEDSHPHILLFGECDECVKFKKLFESTSMHHIVSSRHTSDNVRLNCSLVRIVDERQLRNTGSYVIVQATKDGKAVMPYDYKWGTGSMYFRSKNHIPIWMVDDNGLVMQPRRFGDLTVRERRSILCSKKEINLDWLVCDGVLLPSNYVDVKMFEDIYKTHNTFRVFSSASSKNMDQVLDKMAECRGIMLEDLEARHLCEEICRMLFGKKDTRHMDTKQRLTVARELWHRYKIATRQISTLSRIPEEEIVKYIK